MPYRFDLPEGEEAANYIYAHLGSPKLVAMRQAVFKLVYDAPETTLSLREREAMRFPLTVIIGCPFCNSFRVWRDWPGNTDEPIAEAFYQNAEAQNLDWEGFTTRERLMIEFSVRFSDDIDNLNGDDELWARIGANFSTEEVGDMVILAGAWLGFGRGLKAYGVGSVCAVPAGSLHAAE